MSSVSSISTSSIASMYSETTGTHRRQRPDAATMAEDLFSRLDTTGKGYIEQSDLTSALSSASGTSTSGTTSASEIFSQLDSDGDGKVTQDELKTSIQKLAESLDSQFDQMRMQGAMPPPPPPSESDAGFTKDELTEQLSSIGSTDSARSTLINNVVNNFDAADTNQDGKVSFQEAMAYDKAHPTSSSSSASDSTTSTSSTDTSTSTASAASSQTDAQVFRQLMELLRTYGDANDSTKNLLSTLVTSA